VFCLVEEYGVWIAGISNRELKEGADAGGDTAVAQDASQIEN